jgi:formylglycine-generating enzyme required for sulfatase activity
VITPQTRQLYLSIRKIDQVQCGGLALRRVPRGRFKRDSQSGTVSVLSKEYWLGETEVTNKLWYEVMGYNPEDPHQDDYYPVGNVTWIEAIVFCNKLSILAGKDPVYNLNVSYISKDGSTKGPITGAAWGTFNPANKKFLDVDSDWPVSGNNGVKKWINTWVSDPALLPPGIPYITYYNDQGAPHHYEVENVSIDPDANGYRLPAHQQWMWAAMGADMSLAKLSTVDGISGVNAQDYLKSFAGYNGSNSVADYVWFNDTSNRTSAMPVGGKKPNELGIWDMSGNMGEWCYDQMPKTALVSFTPPGPPDYYVPKPMGDDDHYFADEMKVLKGGSYCSDIPELSFGFVSAYIRTVGMDDRNDQGLRVMRWVGANE